MVTMVMMSCCHGDDIILYRAALGAAEGVGEVIKVVESEGVLDDIEEDKEEFLYTTFYKSKSSCGCHGDIWLSW